MKIFYHLFLVAYRAGIFFVSFWNKKAALWFSGRKNLFSVLQKSLPPVAGKTVWMHCASLGEFEQGRPVLNRLMEEFPTHRFVISFFSPSGYEIVKKSNSYPNVFYLPMDSRIHASKWLDVVKPDLVLWVKYEYWFYYLQETKKRNIPLLMVSAVYRSDQVFFKWYGGMYRQMLSFFTHFFVQNESSKQVLQELILPEKITISGDTRCDRVINIAENFTEVQGIASFCGSSKVVVMGSTWEDDETEWTHFVRNHPELKFIIAPHEIDDENLHDVQKEFANSIFYSDWLNTFDTADAPQTNCLIIDNVGILARLYRYSTIAYVGGGFGDDGLHNILEAAVYGRPVIFGPHFEKNFEARELIDCGGGFFINNALELEKIAVQLLTDDGALSLASNAAKSYVCKNAGATAKIVDFIHKHDLLKATSAK